LVSDPRPEPSQEGQPEAAPDPAASQEPEGTHEAKGPTTGAALVPDDEAEQLARIFGQRPAPKPGEHRSGFVALVGRPNVGKSTILNALVGVPVAITSHRPQTTRRRMLGIRNTESAQVIFVDTPGMHRPSDALGRSMVRAARAAMPEADVVVWVVDVSSPPRPLDRSVAGLLRRNERPLVLALNKTDRLRPEDIEARVAAYRELAVDGADWMLTIATKEHNLDVLWDMIVSHLPEGPLLFPEGQVTDQSEFAIVAELVREAALHNLRQEVPYGIEVVVEEWETREDDLVNIGVRLIVEHDRHKGIVIGKHGRTLKQIGTRARHRIEAFLGAKVFLDVFVSVREDWRHRESDVRRMGYE
jgi:GTP-binding protein Era